MRPARAARHGTEPAPPGTLTSRTLRRVVAAALLGPLVSVCGNEPPTLPETTVIELVSGNGQTVSAGQTAVTPLAVRVRTAAGAPLPGVVVSWSIATGSGAVPATSQSGPDGIAAATYQAGTTTGPRFIAATLSGASGSPVAFFVDVTAGPPATVAKSGDEQFAQVGAAARDPLRVAVTDQFGNPVSGHPVTWAVTAGSATLSATNTITDVSGRAQVTLTPIALSPRVISVTATPGTLAAQQFTATTVRLVAHPSVPIPANYGIHDQFFRDGLLFVSAWNSGLRIYDVGNGILGGTPAAPESVATIITATNGVAGAQVHNAWWFWAPGGAQQYVFVGQEGPGSIGTSSSGDIHVVDVTDLTNPVEVAFYHMTPVNGQSAGTHNFWVDENAQVLYAAYYNGGVVALDVSGSLAGDLAAREIARIRPGGSATYVWGVQLHDGSVYVSDMVSGFWQIRLVGSAFTVAGGGANVPDRYGSDLWVHGSVAYSGTWGSRAGRPGNAVKIWSLGVTGAPAPADSIIVPGISTVSDLEVSDDGLVLMFSAEGGSGNGIYFYSLAADPLRPRFMAFYPVSSGVHTATFGSVAGRRYAFAAKDPASPALVILDVTDLWP